MLHPFAYINLYFWYCALYILSIPKSLSALFINDVVNTLLILSTETDEVQPRPLSSGPASSPSPSPLVKTDCHDSGIDIRDPGSYPGALPTPPPRKAAYSDADILLSDSNEFIPPMPILPLPSGADDRRKAASVSFQVDQSLVQDPTGQAPPGVCDKQETKKKNVSASIAHSRSNRGRWDN